MITIVTKGEGDEEPGMLTIPVSTSIPVTGEGDIVIEQSKLYSITTYFTTNSNNKLGYLGLHCS